MLKNTVFETADGKITIKPHYSLDDTTKRLSYITIHGGRTSFKLNSRYIEEVIEMLREVNGNPTSRTAQE